MRNKPLVIVGALTFLGLALRIIFLTAMKSNWPGWGSPTIDALYHHLWALQVAHGDILGGGPYFRAPFYPLFLGFLYAIWGVNFTIVTLIQFIIGACSIPLTFMAARRFFNSAVAYIATALIAINGILIYFESQLLLDFLTVIFLLLFLILIDRAYIQQKISAYFVAGLVAGLYAITRPNILAVLPMVVIWILFARESLARKVKYSLVLTIGVIILVLPVTIRNAVKGDFVLVASQGGVNFYIGNNERADGMTALLPGFGHTWQYSDAEYEAAEALGLKPGEIKPSQVSAYFTNKALQFIFGHPWQFIKLTIKKLYMFWNDFEISNNNNLYFLTAYIGMSWIPLYLFAIISPMGLVGTAICFSKERRFWIFPILIFGYMITVIAFFVTARFRLPLVPLLTIMAAFTLYEIFSSFANGKVQRAIILTASVLIVGIFAWSNFYGHHDQSMAMAHYSLGNMLLKKGDYQKARDQYTLALTEGYCVPNANLNLGVISFYEKDNAQAETYFRSELATCGPNAKAYNDLSLMARLNNENNIAMAWADSAITHFPNFKEAYINRILAAFAIGDTMITQMAVSDFINIFPGDPAANYYYGLYEYQQNNLADAEIYFKEATSSGQTDIVSEYDLSEIYSSSLPYGYSRQKIRGKSFYYLGLIAANQKDIQKALDFFRQAVSLVPDDPDALANLALAYDQTGDYPNALANFSRAIAIDSTNAIYYFNYAMTLGKTGDYADAMNMLEKAVELNPDFTQAKKILDALKKQLK